MTKPNPGPMRHNPASFPSGLITIEEPATSRHPKPSLRGQVVRFGVVGAINTLVDLAILNLLIALTHTGQRGAMFAVFKTVAFVCAVVNSYLMNRSWTFKRVATKNPMLEGSQFMFVSVLGAVVNVGSSWYVATFIHPFSGIHAKWWPSLAARVGTAFSLAFNFIGYKFWVFAHRKH